MPKKDKELREAVKVGIKILIIQEVRLLRLERTFTPHFIVEAMSQSIQESKRRIINLTRTMDDKERTLLLRNMIRQAVDEEIDRGIRLRGTKCIRCLHGRFYDEEGTGRPNLPVGASRAQMVGCDKLQPALRKKCRRFVEIARGDSLEDYLNEMTFLYEFRKMIDRINEIWREYLTK
jgi:hypothetical protein